MTKPTKITLATLLFLAVSTADIWAIITGNDILRSFAKPLILTFLAVVYLASVKKANSWFVLGLFFSFLGDVFLLSSEANFFMYGLGSFLLAHIMYIKITAGFLKTTSKSSMLFVSFPFVIFLAGLLLLIKDNLGDMLFPVIVYGITISTFGAVALLNYIGEKSTENLWLFLGAIIFIASDSMIAINRFYESNELYGLLIMLTYIIAQYLICKAMVAKNNSLESV
ncbi:MAG: lysoplasmalogenase [Polaribacter sp.]|nr:lysoplasmalogenase [Polaribacter sp.]